MSSLGFHPSFAPQSARGHLQNRLRTRRLPAAVLTALALTLAGTPALADPSPAPGADPGSRSADAAPQLSPREAAAADAQLKLTTTTAPAGAKLMAEYRTKKAHEKNWIGIYPASAGTPDGIPAASLWEYANGDEGSVTFDLGKLKPGAYTVWFLAEDSYTALTNPQMLTVTEAGAEAPGTPVPPVRTSTQTDGVVYRQAFAAAEAPKSWEVELGAQMEKSGPGAWRGWTFTTRDHWTAASDRMRGRFGRTEGTIAVADPGQFGKQPFDSTLRSEPIDVAGESALTLRFDSHYRSASGQRGRVLASFDGGAPVELLRLDGSNVSGGADDKQMNAEQSVPVTIPRGAKQVRFAWELTAENGGEYWAIDSVALHRPVAAAGAARHAGSAASGGASTNAWVVSDIQGHPKDLEHGLHDLSKLRPDPAGLLMVGDIVHSGTQGEWDEIYGVFDRTTDVRPKTTAASIGNHERYAAGGWEANRDRFLKFADRDKVWGEYVLDGPGGQLPVITVGQDAAGPSEVPMSQEQVRFLEDRLAHWAKQKKQVIVNTHYPLADTVSASWLPSLQNAHQHNKHLTELLSAYPNAIIMTGHTHFDGRLADWQVRKRTAAGHPDGFVAINTTGMHNRWKASGETTSTAVEVPGGDMNQGLTVESFGDRVVVKAYDFSSDEQINEITVDNPLLGGK